MTTRKMTTDCLYVSVFVFGIWTLCWSSVTAECRKQIVEWHDLCSTEIYGSIISNHTVTDQMSCSFLCLRHDSCLSHTYNVTNGNCVLNSGLPGDYPECDLNVKYGQVGKYECQPAEASPFQICGRDIYAVPGQVTGYIRVNIGGTVGTVCDDFWKEDENGAQNAYVFCKSLGYSGGSTVYPLGSTSFYQNDTIMMDNVMCVGTEVDIFSCSYLSSSNCVHSEDVRVTCTV